MSPEIEESDWKVFRQLQPVALDRCCQRVLAELDHVASDTEKTNHERYLAVYKLIQRRDKELADAFDDMRRSTAIRQIARIQSHKLWTDEEMSRFSSKTRDAVQFLLDTWRG
jgi:hypothetical protein